MTRLRTGEFVKYQALGNDYLVVHPDLRVTAARARALCDRQRGVGADGVLAFAPPRDADFGVRIFNPDGSEAEKSGNGLRIFARALHDLGYTGKRDLHIETRGGVVRARLFLRGGRVQSIEIGMGRARVHAPETLVAAGRSVEVVPVSIGNPHCVVFVAALDEAELLELGPALEAHSRFPERTNVQLAHVASRSRVELLIWERGAGATLASGSSSCAVAAAAFARGLVDSRVTASMPGGSLEIRIEGDLEIRLKGPATPVFRGRLL
jgi:diaminopimelate epimerase